MEPTGKDNMQITITGEKVEEEAGAGSGRKVARDVDIENFTVLDQVSMSLTVTVHTQKRNTFNLYPHT